MLEPNAAILLKRVPNLKVPFLEMTSTPVHVQPTAGAAQIVVFQLELPWEMPLAHVARFLDRHLVAVEVHMHGRVVVAVVGFQLRAVAVGSGIQWHRLAAPPFPDIHGL